MNSIGLTSGNSSQKMKGIIRLGETVTGHQNEGLLTNLGQLSRGGGITGPGKRKSVLKELIEKRFSQSHVSSLDDYVYL